MKDRKSKYFIKWDMITIRIGGIYFMVIFKKGYIYVVL